MKIKIGPKTWRFIDSFDKFNAETIKDYMAIHNDIDGLIVESQKAIDESTALLPDDIDTKEDEEIAILEGRLDKNYQEKLLVLDAKLEDLKNQIRNKRTDLLVSLCLDDKNKFAEFCLNTEGFTNTLIIEALNHIFDKIGNFGDYWDKCPPVETFAVRASMLPFSVTYKIHDFENTTLLRENIANQKIKEAFQYSNEIVNQQSWDNIKMFIATIVRPLSQPKEFSFAKKAFIKSQKLKGMNSTERLDYYMEQLNKQTENQAAIFAKLSLPVIIGVIKAYWLKKKH